MVHSIASMRFVPSRVARLSREITLACVGFAAGFLVGGLYVLAGVAAAMAVFGVVIYAVRLRPVRAYAFRMREVLERFLRVTETLQTAFTKERSDGGSGLNTVRSKQSATRTRSERQAVDALVELIASVESIAVPGRLISFHASFVTNLCGQLDRFGIEAEGTENSQRNPIHALQKRVRKLVLELWQEMEESI